MAFSEGLPGNDLTKLITCIVGREDATWQVSWASDGSTPPDYSGDHLTSVTERAKAAVASLHADRPDMSDGELQFAIYPWTDYSGKMILDIQESGGGFVARDIQGSGVLVQGSSLEELLSEAERQLPNPHDAMFRWILPASKLLEIDDEGDLDPGGFDPLEAARAVSEALGASGVSVTAADVVTVMSTHAELTGHGDPEADPAERAAAVSRVASATGRRPEVVAGIYDEIDRYLRRRRTGA